MNIATLHTWPEGGKITDDDPMQVVIEVAQPLKTGTKKDGDPWTRANYKIKDDSGEMWGSCFVNEGDPTPDQQAMAGCSASMTGVIQVYNGKKSINNIKLEIMGGNPYLKAGQAPAMTTSAKPKGVTDQEMVSHMTNWANWLAQGLQCKESEVTACVNTLAIAFLAGNLTIAPKAKPDAGVDSPTPEPADQDGPADDDIPF